MRIISLIALLCASLAVCAAGTHGAAAEASTPLHLQVTDPTKNGDGLNSVNSLAQSIGAGAFGAQVRNMLPRFGFTASLSAVIKNGDYASYGIGIAIQFAYGLVLAILTLCVGCCFCCCRCCCNWCGGREPIEGGYSKCQRWFTWVVMLIFSLAVCAFAVLGWFNNNQVTTTAVGSTGVLGISVGLLSNIMYYLNGAVPPVGNLINSAPIAVQLSSINANVLSSVSTIQGLLAQTGVIFTGVDTMINTINATGGSMSATTVVVNGTSFACSYCATVGNKVMEMSTQLKTNSAQPLADMKKTISTANDTLASTATSITAQISSFKTTINNLVANASTYYTKLTGDWKNTATTYDNYRNVAVLAILVLPCLSLLSLIAGLLFKSGCPFTFYYWIGYIASFLVFVLCAIHLPLSVVVGDTCTYVNTIDSNFSALPLDSMATSFLNAAIYNTSLIDAFDSQFGLKAKLNFTNAITFPTIPDISSKFQFSAISNFTTQVRALDLTTFGFYMSNTTKAIAQVNTYTFVPPTTFTRATISSCPGACTSACTGYEDVCLGARALTLQEAGLNATLAGFKGNATLLDDAAAQFQTQVTGVYNTTFGTLKTVLNPIFASVNSLTASAYCGFIGVSYYQFKSALCDSFLSTFTMIALCAFAIGILNFAVIVCATVLAKRMPNPQDDANGAVVVELDELIQRNAAMPRGNSQRKAGGVELELGLAPVGSLRQASQAARMSTIVVAPPPMVAVTRPPPSARGH